MNSSESAEAIVKMMLEGTEVAARITGAGAKELAIMLYTMHKDNKMTKGKTNLNNMLKTGSSLKIFSLKEEELKKFHQEAKRYGVLYTAVTDKKHNIKDGMVDIYVKEDDAPKVNRIVERFKLSAIDIAEIKSEIQRDKIEAMLKDAKERGVEVKSDEERLADEIMSKPIQKEVNENINPNVAKTEKSPLSEPSLESKKSLGVTSKRKKPSVRQALKDIRNEIKSKDSKDLEKQTIQKDKELSTKKENAKTTYTQPKKKSTKKKEKGR